ncbi:adenine-specific methyltransferase EcoRI family protein [Psittacicella gerlachiana]|uniref:Adenosine deaminase n=1 Tax=Psittacicella gerlachiana TaxID=2028574 RepID=A0A3A1Y108_9GAMM|nr:adenine-specific methyltransferase EcoRI family protein [Psittacicella gerlachiana]RIY32032.1 adenosine deaminase [Psittacicella gerlachiana]
MKTNFLSKAKKNKNDEFYTQLIDIESELQHYTSNFKDKIVFCNCDDPLTSNFYKYFALNFKRLGLKKLISACYVNVEKTTYDLEATSPARGYYYEYTGGNEELFPSIHEVTYFNEDGDFRSAESITLLEQADIIVTNPPFSLFREFIELVITHNKQFLVIGNINAITYKDIFALIKENKAWLGINLGRGISGFIVPEHYELYGTETKINEHGERIVASNNCLWLTNLDNFKRHKDIELVKTYQGNENNYPKYDNYEGINVNKTQDIPKDYLGAMGVPITFLHKFNPEQFEIIKFRKGDDGKDLSINGKCPYFRILMINKRLQK